MLDRPRLLLKLEGLAILVAAVALYAEGDYSWLLFAVSGSPTSASTAASATA